MKRKIIMGLIATLTITTLLVGCGNKNDATNSEQTNTNTNTENESENDEISGSVGDVVGDTETGSEDNKEEVEVLIKLYEFPAGSSAKGYTKKVIEDENKNWSENETYVALANGEVMTFTWEGPMYVGARVYSGDNTVFLENTTETLKLIAYSNGWHENLFENVKNSTKENIVSGNTTYKYVENGYYEDETTDSTIRITFAIDSPEKKAKGYACYIVDNNKKIVYQFNYVESYDEYNDARALDVVDSITFKELPKEPNME